MTCDAKYCSIDWTLTIIDIVLNRYMTALTTGIPTYPGWRSTSIVIKRSVSVASQVHTDSDDPTSHEYPAFLSQVTLPMHRSALPPSHRGGGQRRPTTLAHGCLTPDNDRDRTDHTTVTSSTDCHAPLRLCPPPTGEGGRGEGTTTTHNYYPAH